MRAGWRGWPRISLRSLTVTAAQPSHQGQNPPAFVLVARSINRELVQYVQRVDRQFAS
jgi:hypothetical protein